jgi:spore germination protein YaaH/putative cell wall-binding protein
MPQNRRLRAFALLLAVSLLVLPAPAAAADPTLGEAITLPDGTVLPPMPPELLGPSIHSEMDIEHGALGAEGSASGDVNALSTVVEQAAPIVAVQGASVGPGGPLPNGLTHEVLGFLPHWKLDATSRAALRLDMLSTIAYFGIGAQTDGSLVRGNAGWNGWVSGEMTQVMNAAHARGVKVVPTITMMSGAPFTNMTTLLNSAANRARLVGEITSLIRGRGADGVNVDFEPVPASLRSQFTAFIRELKAGMINGHAPSYLTVSTMAGAAAWSTGYDVVGLTAPGAADALMVMAYDFHWSGSARAGSPSPIDSDTIYASADAMRDHLARVPGSKLIWGVPYYGRAWNTTSASRNSTVRSPAESVAFSYYWTDAGEPAGGRVLAERFGRQWDPIGQVPWFAFWDAGSNGYRQGYYDDPTSLTIKYDRVRSNGLAGIGIWHLGMDTGVPDLWNVIWDRFVKVIDRYAGMDRYGTAAQVSRATYAPGVAAAYVATGANFPDALAAGPVAARAGGPVLLTAAGSLPAATAEELARLRPQSIFVLGGPNAVSDGVLEVLRGYATTGTVGRLWGPDRYATAAAASAASFSPGVPVAYVATGTNFPDALAGGVAAGRFGGPILLASRDDLPASTIAELSRLRPGRVVVIGGPGVVGDGVLNRIRPYTGGVTRIFGADRYATAVALSQSTTVPNTETVYIATGTNFPDGLSATPAAVQAVAPLLTLPGNRIPPAVAAELRRLDPQHIIILGGPSAVSDALVAAIRGLWD